MSTFLYPIELSVRCPHCGGMNDLNIPAWDGRPITCQCQETGDFVTYDIASYLLQLDWQKERPDA